MSLVILSFTPPTDQAANTRTNIGWFTNENANCYENANEMLEYKGHHWVVLNSKIKILQVHKNRNSSFFAQQSFYKSMLISKKTTAVELIQLMLNYHKRNDDMRDFQLVEVDENKKGKF